MLLSPSQNSCLPKWLLTLVIHSQYCKLAPETLRLTSLQHMLHYLQSYLRPYRATRRHFRQDIYPSSLSFPTCQLGGYSTTLTQSPSVQAMIQRTLHRNVLKLWMLELKDTCGSTPNPARPPKIRLSHEHSDTRIQSSQLLKTSLQRTATNKPLPIIWDPIGRRRNIRTGLHVR